MRNVLIVTLVATVISGCAYNPFRPHEHEKGSFRARNPAPVYDRSSPQVKMQEFDAFSRSVIDYYEGLRNRPNPYPDSGRYGEEFWTK